MSKVLLKKSSVTGKIPAAIDLEYGELAINYTDEKIYFKNASNVIKILGGGGGSGTVTSVAALTIGTTGTDVSSTVATETTAPVITLNIPTASAINRGVLSATDWSTFNAKAPTVSPTFSGTTTIDGTFGNIYLTTYGSIFVDGDSTNNIIQTSSLSRTKGGGLWSTGANTRIYSVDTIEFRTGVTLRDQDTPTGGSTVLTIDTSGNLTSTGTVTANSVLLTGNTGTVTSVGGAGTVAGLTLSGTVTTSGSLTLGGTLSTPVSTINDSTTVGQNLVKLTNPSAITFLRVNADNTASALDATSFRTAIGAGTSSTSGTVTSVAALTIGTTGTDVSSTVATETTTPIITLNIPTASATNRGVLSATDWSTFNNKQSAGAYLTTAVTSVATGTGLSGGTITTTGTISLANTAVTAGSYTTANITVDAQGRITAATSGGATVTDDTTTNATRYLVWEDVTSGTASSIGVSSTKLTFNPSTGDVSATNFNSLSDENKKKDIETITESIELLMHLRGVFFRWKDNGVKSMGVIAQEVEKVIPEVVVTLEDGTKTVSYGLIVGLLIEAVKNHEERIRKLELAVSNLI